MWRMLCDTVGLQIVTQFDDTIQRDLDPKHAQLYFEDYRCNNNSSTVIGGLLTYVGLTLTIYPARNQKGSFMHMRLICYAS